MERGVWMCLVAGLIFAPSLSIINFSPLITDKFCNFISHRKD